MIRNPVLIICLTLMAAVIIMVVQAQPSAAMTAFPLPPNTQFQMVQAGTPSGFVEELRSWKAKNPRNRVIWVQPVAGTVVYNSLAGSSSNIKLIGLIYYVAP